MANPVDPDENVRSGRGVGPSALANDVWLCQRLVKERGEGEMRGWRLLCAAGVFCWCCTARADWMDDVEAADQRGDYASVIKLVLPRAKQGNAFAQFALGVMYYSGHGVAQDNREAVKWYRLAAEQGNAGAQSVLGGIYRQGQGVAQDDKEAARWYGLAAKQGVAHAQFALGFMYKQGQGVTQDYREAVRLFRLAAAQGNAGGQYALGGMYEQGRGVAQDYVKAHALANMAAAQGMDGASATRDGMGDKMTADQIARAQELASRCVAQSYKNCGF